VRVGGVGRMKVVVGVPGRIRDPEHGEPAGSLVSADQEPVPANPSATSPAEAPLVYAPLLSLGAAVALGRKR
jgi:hypothetical protein